MEKINWTTVVISVVVAVVVFYLLSAFAPGLSPNYGTGVGQGTTFVNANACNKDEICEVNALDVAQDSIFRDDPRFELGFASDSHSYFNEGNIYLGAESGEFSRNTSGNLDVENAVNVRGHAEFDSTLDVDSTLQVAGDILAYGDKVVITAGDLLIYELGNSSVGYVCVTGSNGRLFRSDTPCV